MENTPPAPVGDPVPPTPPPVIGQATPATPPAAATVAAATRTERELALEDELRQERETHTRTADEKKQRELRIAELEDEIWRLKTPPTPTAKKKTALHTTLLFSNE